MEWNPAAPGFFINKVSLTVDGEKFAGWLTVDITTNIKSLARTFALQVTRSAKDGTKLQAITPGKDVVIKIGNDVVVTGFVTAVDMTYNGSSIGVTVSGAGKTVDLEDCTIPADKPKQYRSRTPCELLRLLCGYFGIEVVDDVGVTQRSDFNAGVTDTIKQSIQKLIKSKGLLISDDEYGRLVISNVGESINATDAIETGVNVLSASRHRNIRNRFYTYAAIGQQANPLSESEIGAAIIKKAVDETFERKERIKVLQLTGNTNAQELRSWACVVRDQAAADGDFELEYVVQGWRQSDGSLWKKNRTVVVKDSVLGVKKRLLIHSVKFSLSGSGMTTTLSVKPLNAFLVTDAPDKATAKDTGGDLSGIIANSGKIK